MTSAAIRLSCACLLAILSICSGQTNGSACVQYGDLCADDQACCDTESGVKCGRSKDWDCKSVCHCLTPDQFRPGGVCCSGNITASKCPRGGVDILCRNNSDCAEGLDCENFLNLDKSLSLHRAFRGTCQVAPTTSTPPRKTTPGPSNLTSAKTSADECPSDMAVMKSWCQRHLGWMISLTTLGGIILILTIIICCCCCYNYYSRHSGPVWPTSKRHTCSV